MKNKKALAMLLVVAMLFAGVSASVFAKTSTGITVAYNEKTNILTVTIPESAVQEKKVEITLDDLLNDVVKADEEAELETIAFDSPQDVTIQLTSIDKDSLFDIIEHGLTIQLHEGCAVYNSNVEALLIEDQFAWNATKIVSAHTLDEYKEDVVNKVSTCTTSGTKNVVCKVCGLVLEKNVKLALDLENHELSTTPVDKIPATCTKPGYNFTRCNCAACQKIIGEYTLTDPKTVNAELINCYKELVAEGMATMEEIKADHNYNGKVFIPDGVGVCIDGFKYTTCTNDECKAAFKALKKNGSYLDAAGEFKSKDVEIQFYELAASKGYVKKEEVKAIHDHSFDLAKPVKYPTLLTGGEYACVYCGEVFELPETMLLYKFNEIILQIANTMYRLIGNIDLSAPGIFGL